MPTRGCGTRQVGAVYLVSEPEKGGKPIEWFMPDPPVPLPESLFDMRKNGHNLHRFAGIYHAVDWVGESYYPNVADFVEEARLYGASRRCSPRLDFSLLQNGSCFVFVHRRAIIVNHMEMRVSPKCVKRDLSPPGLISRPSNSSSTDPQTVYVVEGAPGERPHLNADDLCAGVYWHDVEGTQEGHRTIGDTRYPASARPHGFKPVYSPGIFLLMPITGIAVIKDPQNELETMNLRDQIARQTWLHVSLEDR